MTILSAALLLFLILDPLGNIPVFLSVLKPLAPRRQRIVLARELLIALLVLYRHQSNIKNLRGAKEVKNGSTTE